MGLVVTTFLRWLSLIKILTLALALQSKSCYRYDGSLNDYSYDGFAEFFPCNPGQEASHCCYGLDVCLDNGLCMGYGPAPGKDRVLTMGGCTDATWPSPCPQYFVQDRHHVPDGLKKIVLWLCAPGEGSGEYCVGSKDIGGVGAWDASCCANASLRIKNIPWQKSMHLAMDPTRKIEIYTGHLPPSLPDGGSGGSNGLEGNTISGIVIGVAGLMVTFAIGFCQWQFPETRIHWKWKRGRQGNAQEAHVRYQTSDLDLAEIPPPFTTVEVLDSEEPETPSVSYSDRIGNLLEDEDGWREPRLPSTGSP